MTAPADKSQAPGRVTLRIVPVVVFLLLAGVFALMLRSGDPTRLPSTLIGKPAPRLSLPALVGLEQAGRPIPGVAPETLETGRPTVVNFWASWCAPCVAEHPLLLRLVADTGVALVGINHKDAAPNARRFLGRYGNPFTAVGVDADGRAAIEWGVYGMPETFVLDGKGRIVYKHIGPLSAETLAEKIVPAVRTAQRTP
jgi:cytochrome c biogenesis protein CcmG/thiol:disulfide interchange protein DsbE